MVKLIHILGLLSFVGSFFAPASAQKMTSWHGEEVELWTPPAATHWLLALEPTIRVIDYCSAKKDPNDHGDGFEAGQAESIRRAFYSTPAAYGWFIIVASVLIVPWAWIRPITNALLRRCLRIAGWILLAAVPLLTLDFYRHATTYEGYFHLGLGAYLIVTAYLFIGSSLLLQFARAKKAEPIIVADRPPVP